MSNHNGQRTAEFDTNSFNPASSPKHTTLHPPASDGNPVASVHATIGKSLIIKGEITGSEALYVDGQVEGAINLPGNRVTIGSNGEVKATITALEVVVQGKVIGNVSVSGRLEVRSEGSLIGDAVAGRISLADGAVFKGKIDVLRPAERADQISAASDHSEMRPV
jgi:cytoskeletal protein CcmA (bactofilin family)